MTKLRRAMSISTVPSFLLLGVISAATLPGELSKYRNYELGTDLSTVAGQTGANPSQAKVIHNRRPSSNSLNGALSQPSGDMAGSFRRRDPKFRELTQP